MAAVNAFYSAPSYLNLLTTQSANTATKAAAPQTATTSEPAATSVTLSSEARAALAVKDFATVIADTRTKLATLLKDAGRTSPLEGDKLALDLSSLDPRELYAMTSDQGFSKDEQAAAGLEMQRRFEAALSGPAALAKVTGNFTALYKAAGEFLDGLSAEEKAGEDWIAGRAAVTDGLKQLQADPKTLPDTGDGDPVALYLALLDAGQAAQPHTIADVATSARKTLDRLYAAALKDGKTPTFNKQTTVGTYIDLSQLDSRTLSAISLNTDTKFASQEVTAATAAMRTKSGAALVAGFQNAAKSSDPTAFSQNIISLYSAMSTEERQASGWSDNFYKAAVDSYQSTSKLTQLFAQAGGSATGFMSWMGK